VAASLRTLLAYWTTPTARLHCALLKPSTGISVALSGIALLAGCNSKSAQRTRSGVPPGEATTPLLQPSASASTASAKAFYADRYSKKPFPPDVMELGRTLFFDPALSASQKMSCASCHDPRFAYGPPNDRSTQLGGPELKDVGLRAAPSLRYLQTVPRFSEHYFEEAVDESADQGPTGGHTWDGRADTLHDQARLPLISPLEMANESVDSVVAKVEQAAYAARFRQVFGDDVFAEPTRASSAVLLSLEVFQQSPKDFYPYTSRYDTYLRKQGQLSAAEQRGLALFDDPNKGNCAHCHPSQIRSTGFPQFTDFGFAALGVPRNKLTPNNQNARFFDLGLCGPLRTDLSSHREYCGMFRAPSLRNVALRRAFFHNGVFHQLEEVVRFYVQRDTQPAKWYPSVAGHTEAFDDLPPDVKQSVNREPPFGRKPGQAAALNAAEIKDLVGFLSTLTDQDLQGGREQASPDKQ
jgi:cytochrome c peroxidase